MNIYDQIKLEQEKFFNNQLQNGFIDFDNYFTSMIKTLDDNTLLKLNLINKNEYRREEIKKEIIRRRKSKIESI